MELPKADAVGEFITCHAPYGYRLVNGTELEIQPGEAEVVRWIFKSYLSGKGSQLLANDLNARGVPAPVGSIWRGNTIRRLLKNEKYIGDTLTQKTYRTDTFPPREMRNCGERAMYYVSNSHWAIIDREAFQKTGELLKSRETITPQDWQKSLLHSRVICGECGAAYRRKRGHGGRISWVCRRHDNSAAYCPGVPVSELELQAAFVRMYNKLKVLDPMLKSALRSLREHRAKNEKSRPERLALSGEIARLTDEAHIVAQLYARNLLDTEMYLAKSDAVNRRIAELSAKRRALSESEEDETEEQLEALILTLAESPERLYGFDRTLFETLVERITVSKSYTVTFRLRCGLELGEKIYGEVK